MIHLAHGATLWTKGRRRTLQMMGNYGRKRVENELAWHHEVPKLLAVHEALWSGEVISSPVRRVET